MSKKKSINFKDKSDMTIPVSAIVLVVLVLSIIIISAWLQNNKILKGISVNNVYIGFMKRSEAADKLKVELEQRLKDNSIDIKYADKEWKLKYEDVKGHYDVEAAVEDAWKISRKSNLVELALINLEFIKRDVNIEINAVYDEELLRKKLQEIADNIAEKPIDATITYKAGTFNVTSDIQGTEADKEVFLKMVKEILVKGVSGTCNVPVVKTQAQKTEEMLKAIKVKLSRFQTSFYSSSGNRATNIIVGTKSADGAVVMPGEVFSLNKVLGPRVARYGYKEAKVIVNGEVVQGMGGGVCQVATTLYNAALLADLDIVERKNHGLPSTYIAMGRDATISAGYIDLKIKNNRSCPIYIRGVISGSTVAFEIYGDDTTKNLRVDIKTEIVEIIKPKPRIINDYSLPWGTTVTKEGSKNGYKVKSYRKTYIDGKLVRDEILGEDKYLAVNGVVVRGMAGKP
ncbi:vancomycin B-type resistance protein VanW [Oxobacter pfennigii]|uniref:Vancomycin B-type resistance protein VanW n=1 Tax=Oxobacter pfennigii TaxID=36849 RepID=A0A0P8WC29_9CLOT|nr:VanW family protein [Oxobacter pfennigii]KPU45275.1 vancomycin B-type resistance protein VanW [Oxobacter pfennigii]